MSEIPLPLTLPNNCLYHKIFIHLRPETEPKIALAIYSFKCQKYFIYEKETSLILYYLMSRACATQCYTNLSGICLSFTFHLLDNM